MFTPNMLGRLRDYLRFPGFNFTLAYSVTSIAENAADGASIGRVIANGLGTWPAGYTSSFQINDANGQAYPPWSDPAGRLGLDASGNIYNIAGALVGSGGLTLTPRIKVVRASDGAAQYIDVPIAVTAAAGVASGTETSPSAQARDYSLSIYGDSDLSEELALSTNTQITTALMGRMRLAPGFNHAVGGATVLGIRDKMVADMPTDTASHVKLLWGMNNYSGAANTSDPDYIPPPATTTDWNNRFLDMVQLVTVTYGKKLIVLIPILSPNDTPTPLAARQGHRDFLRSYKGTNPKVLIVETNDYLLNPDSLDGNGNPSTHPAPSGATKLANDVVREMTNAGSGWIDLNPYPLPTANNAGDAIANSQMTGTGGAVTGGASGPVADGWTLNGKFVGSKTTLLGNTAQRIAISPSATGISSFALSRTLDNAITVAAGDSYEVVARVRVYSPNGEIPSFTIGSSIAWDTAEPDGSFGSFTGNNSRVMVMRTKKLVATAAGTISSVQFTGQVKVNSTGAYIDIAQVAVRKVSAASTASPAGQHYDNEGNPISAANIASGAAPVMIYPCVPATEGSFSSYAISAPAAVAEGNSGTTNQVFTVTRSGTTNYAETVAWSVSGSGTNPANATDFVGAALPSGTLSFASGDTSKTITIPIQGDTTYEPDETYTVTLGTPSAGGTLGTSSAQATITNDDAASVSSYAIAAPAAQAEGNSGTTAFVFTVTRSGATGFAETLNYATTGSSANPASASDFVGGVLPSGTVSFASGDTSKTISIPVQGDTTAESNEGFTVTISNPTAGGSISTAAASTTILDDDTVAGTTWNSTVATSSLTYANSNTRVGRTPASGIYYARGNTAIPTTGQVHFAFKVLSSNAMQATMGLGVCDNTVGGLTGGTGGTNVAYRTTSTFTGTTGASGLSAFALGDVVDVEVDRKSGKIRYAINGGGWGADLDISGLTAASIYACGRLMADTAVTLDLLPQSSFMQAMTSGFAALN